jgi:hypothetical protein
LGVPQGTNVVNFVSLGFGGKITLRFKYAVENNANGLDLQVVETSYGNPSCNAYPEKARFEGSLDGTTWTDLGELCQDGKLEMGTLPYLHLLRITDVSDKTKFGSSADGFDVVRDQAFFNRQASDWFASRRLVVPSFADYEQRRVVSAAGLGYESMWSQHTTQTRMHYADRMRLAEVRGVMQADEADAQHNRLVYYYREADYLRQQNDMVLLDALMSRINPLLGSFDSRAANDHFSDTVTAVPLLLLQAERAEWLFRRSVQESAQERAQESAQNSDAESTGQNVDASQQFAGQGQQLAFYVLSQADSAALNQQLIRDLSYRALGAQVTNLLEINAMSEARSLIAQFPDDCAASAFCINAIEQFYMSQGQQYWAQRNWPSAIFIYEEYLARGLQTNNRRVFENNLQSAYLNQAEQHWFDEERDEAIAMLEVCVITVAAPQRCQQRLQAARQGR